jgi:MFS family permease
MQLLGLFLWVGLGGLGVSGMVPMFRLHHEEISVELTYFIYFFFSFAMQMGVYFFKPLRRVQPMFLISQVGFALTMIGFGLYSISNPAQWNSFYVLALRMLEGLSMGLAMPLAFEMIVQADSKLKVAQKILFLNLANLLGFILGAPLFDLLTGQGEAGWLFVGIGAVTFCFGLVLHFSKMPSVVEPAVELKPEVALQGRWTERYFFNFLAKLFFGYLLTMIAVDAGFLPFSLRMIPVVLAAVFFIAQVILVQVLKRTSVTRLEVPIVVLLSLSLALHLGTGSYLWILLAMGFQSMVQFVGLEKISETPQTSKEFALINSMSDPGQILGAAICQFKGVSPEVWIMLVALLPLFWRKKITEVKRA